MTDTTAPATPAQEVKHQPGVEHGDHIAPEHAFGTQYALRLTLTKAIERGSMAPVKSLYLREPTAADLKGVSLANLANFYESGEVLAVLQRVCMPKISPAEAAALTMRDTVAAGNAISHFLA